MQVHYLVEITDPQTHMVKVRLSAQKPDLDKLSFFMPSWSPGSYLMREYARNIRTISVKSSQGEYLSFDQSAKGVWEIDFKNSDLKGVCTSFDIEYEVYCHELTVRTSHVDESHAFLHGPSYLIGIKDHDIEPIIEFRFPALWSKLHTGLKDISEQREKFVYSAPNYDDLIDCPVEIGCHESDGFLVQGKEHHLIWYGESYPHNNDLKADIKTIVETVSSHFSDIPYDSYLFMTHFKRNLYGGLEHKNSTALHFDGRMLSDRESYVNWLALVAHEYFHTWNVKRIRPKELGPFDYLNENYTRLHWLTEGLTSFMDELFVLRAELCTLEEYLKMQTKNLQRYLDIPGKKFHSLEDSSFNAWVKLYRPDENSNNSSVSYYLKGGLVFSTLHFDLKKQGKNINDLLDLLWKRYNDNPEDGVTRDEVLTMIETVGGKEVRDRFEMRLSTTEDIDFETYYQEIGCEFEWDQPETVDLGLTLRYQGDQAFVASVKLDSSSFKAGINAQDELIAINGLRVLKDDLDRMTKMLIPGKSYSYTCSRQGTMVTGTMVAEKAQRRLKSIKIIDQEKALSALKS
ncbi:MAG: hypothetical protein CME65_00510 [Halobacteriovoraceae bacterium]|nr:hypothetical protein [Halobacteriovoraceae bacterium]|tara:strand:+ start:6651 stop:8366 length:1716 start_codon:yes stop_codon:yes gene_type:complete